MGIRHKRLETGIVVNLSGRDQALTDRDHAVLRDAHVLRIDPSNSCNAACVFCESAFNARGARLPLEVFAEALRSVEKSALLDTLQFGCTYEPTIRKDFTRFGELLADARLDPGPEFISIVSNCWLLHRHDLEPFVLAGLNKLHVSLHAHERDEFKAVMGHDQLDQTVANLQDFKRRFPGVSISAVCVVNRLNARAPADFARWAFHEVGVDYLRFTRAQIAGDRVNSPAKAALAEDGVPSFEVDDATWADFVAEARSVNKVGLLMEQSHQNLKNSAIKVDALRIRRQDAPSEVVAMRASRERSRAARSRLVSVV